MGQNQKTAVVGNKPKASRPLLRVPANEAIPRFDFPGRAAKKHGSGTTFVSPNFRVGFSAGPGKTCCRNKRQQEEPPVGLEAGSPLRSQGKWLGVGGTFCGTLRTFVGI
jgi:hypothetical protein